MTANTRDAILERTRELLERLIARNEVAIEDIGSVFFTMSDDLNAVYPALAARQLGWLDTALMCAREIPVPGEQVTRCIRILMMVNTTRTAAQIRHVYLHDAVRLRPTRADTVETTDPTEIDQ